MKVIEFAKSLYVSIAVNLIYAVANCAIGFISPSWWFITVGAYYFVLTANRYAVLRIKQKAGGAYQDELRARRLTGILLIVLSFCIVGVNVLSAVEDRGTQFHEIIMITVATYTFSKIIIAIIGMVRIRHTDAPVLQTLRNISMADACVSICTMQRSMLQTFPGMEADAIRLLNILTGTAVWVIVLLLGINLLGRKTKTPATTNQHNDANTTSSD